ncbi:hypothetical protein F5Y15DRAFT_378999 [Xylariaceae sp. FL0016]|nr:hypothetical protein F5Y15DRAFT_378999 [Xylariaceae sp. FL0016]
MTSRDTSPRRRHILSSINPDQRTPSPTTEHERATLEPPPHELREEEEEQATETAERKTSKFRFKKSSRSHRTTRHRDRDHDRHEDREDHEHERVRRSASPSSSHRHRHHRHLRHHHHRRKRHRVRSRSRSPTPHNPHEPAPLDPDAAFRESLFDAMADDEGAAYWEGVYGQPIHIYGAEATNAAGELERMTEDEYAAYVRRKMWEKTHAGLLEERERRKQREREREAAAEEARRLTRDMERSLRRGEERKRKRGWRGRWDRYVASWDGWDGTVERMGWPTDSGLRETIDTGKVREFFVMGIDPTEVGEAELLAKLKEERVRWHPDKIQQRLGGKVDEAVMQDVTAVFQIVDKLWSDTRSKA